MKYFWKDNKKAGENLQSNKKMSRSKWLTVGIAVAFLFTGFSSVLGDWYITSDYMSSDDVSIGSDGQVDGMFNLNSSGSGLLDIRGSDYGLNDSDVFTRFNKSGINFRVNDTVMGSIGVYQDRLSIGFSDGTSTSDGLGVYTRSGMHGEGDYAFRGGVLTSSGDVVMIPCSSDYVGVYDPVADVYTQGPAHGEGDSAFWGGVLTSSGDVVMIPHNSDYVGVYNTGTGLGSNDLVLKRGNHSVCVGVNTTNPGYQFHVIGDAFIDGTFGDASDARIKDVLGELPESDVRLFCENIEFKYFNYLEYVETTRIGNRTVNMINFTGRDTGRDGVGLIAQELYENLTTYFPSFVDEFVVRGNNNRLWGIDYGKVSALFCRYTQLLHEDIVELQSEIDWIMNNGHTGSFTNADGDMVTVENGIITNIE